jgi:hypothetical protein
MVRLAARIGVLIAVPAMVLVCMTAPAGAEPLKIDFNSTSQDNNGPHLQEGYQAYDAAHEVADDFVTREYAAFGTTVSLTPTWPDTTDNRVQQMIDRTTSGPPVESWDANYEGTLLDLVTDWIGIDARPGNGGNGADQPTSLDLTLAGLPAGAYRYLAYHHDTENQNGDFTISVTDADGTRTIGTFEMTASSEGANTPNPVNPGPGISPMELPSTIHFPIVSNGEPIIIEYQITEGANVHESFLGVNGIEVTQIPEPSTLVLLLVGCVAALLCGKRRRG